MSKEISSLMPHSDRTTIKNSFNPPSNFKAAHPDKYGKAGAQEIYNELCTQGVENVVQSILELKEQEPDFEATKVLLKRILEDLANIRSTIAQQTGTQEAERFGRSRKENPITTDNNAIVVDITSICNTQHFAAHEQIKKLLKAYLPKTIQLFEKEKFYQSIVTDNKTNPQSRYILTLYKQVAYELKPINNLLETRTVPYSPENLIEVQEALLSGDYLITPIYECGPIVSHLVAEKSRKQNKPIKNIIVGEVQIKLGDEFITGTRHVTWFNNSLDEFMSDSEVCLLHPSTEKQNLVLEKISRLWHEAIWYDPDSAANNLNEIMADIEFLFGQSLFFYRGSPTITKILFDGTYYINGFLPSPQKGDIDAYCTAEYFPFMQQYRRKFKECFESGPGTIKTEQAELKSPISFTQF